MTTLESLQSMIKKTPLLLVHGDKMQKVDLLPRDEATQMFAKMLHDPGVLVDLSSTLPKILHLARDPSRDFTTADLCKVTGMLRPHVTGWVPKIVRASEQGSDGIKGRARKFTVVDIFWAGQAASLRRAGVSLATLEKASKLIYEEEKKTQPKRRKKVKT